MKKILRKVIPQSAINIFYHLPEAFIANLIHGFPSRKLKVIGVTGTDGKTTTVNMIYRLLKAADKRVSMVSTINAVIGEKEYETGFHITSPGRFAIQRLIKQATTAGSEYLVLEVTSHALDQYRFWGIKVDIGVITNITHEHLDYHGTFQHYRDTKLKLLKGAKWAILNKDDPSFEYLRKNTQARVQSFGETKGANVSSSNFPLKLKIPGDYNLLNALAAASVGKVLEIEDRVIKGSLENFQNLEGRMEEIKNKKGIRIFIDFAHTPNGLSNVLSTLRKIKPKLGHLISIIGCEGYRDIGKRAKMGEISSKMADITIITSVDPRGKISEINSQIMEGVKKAGGILGKNVFIENDRKKAIDMAVNLLVKRGDIIGIFGKGHEKSMNLDGKRELRWSDRKTVEEVLDSR